jgi:hypothetical protein
MFQIVKYMQKKGIIKVGDPAAEDGGPPLDAMHMLTKSYFFASARMDMHVRFSVAEVYNECRETPNAQDYETQM